jgi:protein-disulfide isomerase
LATNILLLVMTLVFWLGLTESPSNWKRWTFYLGGLSALASVVMAVISFTQLTTYCLFCIALYFLSFGTLIGLYLIQDEAPLKKFGEDLKGVFGASKPLALCFISVPVIAFLTHASIVKNYEAGELQRVAQAFIQEWKSSPKVDFNAPASYVQGASDEKAKLVIAEFADFRCGHCKAAAPSLDAFIKSHLNEVQFRFYNFPLDSVCNPEMPGEGDGVSCRLAKSVHCADKQGKGPALHDELFEQQARSHEMHSAAEVDKALEEYSSKLSISFDQLVSCMNETQTQDAMIAQIRVAKAGALQGTPTIFANGRKLERGQLIPVLEMALRNADEVKP